MSIHNRLAAVDQWNAGVPAIHGPNITGASAMKPFLYTVPVTGERPLFFSVEGLPDGLSIDNQTGKIAGIVARENEYHVLLRVENRHGKAEKEFDIVIGKGLALTPPMGWNSWNAWRRWVDDDKVRKAAFSMVNNGLAARGYTYINIDSCWQGERGGIFNAIQPNSKFPDMKGLSEYIHGLGLKFGIYSSPWVEPWGCSAEEAFADWGGGALIGCSAGAHDTDYPNHHPTISGKFVGINKYEPNDVAQFIEWEVDFLKYDWTPTDPQSLERMARPLKASSRDIILSVCTDAKIKWADSYIKWTEMWRSIPDTNDVWSSVLMNGFFADDQMGCEEWRQHVRPGKWNDLDMTALGPQFDTMTTTKANGLTHEEQITHMTLWALYPSPLILSCDLESINDFELRLFGNEEVIAVNQDSLGKASVRIREERRLTDFGNRLTNIRIQAREMADSTKVVGLFNLADTEDIIEFSSKEINMPRNFKVRNLWERKDMGTYTNKLSIAVPAHGAQLLRVSAIE